MAEKKTIIETNAHPVRSSGSDAEHDVEAGLRLAMELQDAGVVLTSEVLAALTMRFEYEAQALRYCARIQVPAEFDEPDEVAKPLRDEPDDIFAPAAPEIDVVTAKAARVRAASTLPHDVIAAANLASRTLALERTDAGLAPTGAPITLAVATDSHRVFVTASHPALKPF